MKNQAGRRHPGVAWLLAFFILHSSFCIPAPGAVVRYYIMDQSGTNVLRTSVRFTSLTNPQLGQNTNYLGLRDFALANTNAPLDVTLHSGRWRVTVGPLSWVNSIPDTNGLILASSWPDLTWSNALPGSLVAGSNVVVYVTNGVYVVNATASASGSGYFYPGTNTAWRTVGGSNVVDVVGVLTNPISIGDGRNILTNAEDNAAMTYNSGNGSLVTSNLGLIADGVIYSFGNIGTLANFHGAGIGLTNGNWPTMRNAVANDGADKTGANNSGLAISNALFYVAATNGAVTLEPGRYRITASVVWTNASTLHFSDGAQLVPDSGVTVYIRGGINARPAQQIFSGAGTISFATNYTIGEVPVGWFGSDPSGANSSTLQIQSAVTAARMTKNEVLNGVSGYPSVVRNESASHAPWTRYISFLSGGNYLITNTITWQENWHGGVRGNGAMIQAISMHQSPTNHLFLMNDCRFMNVQDLIFQCYMTNKWLSALCFSNIATVETATTPFNNYISRLKWYGHRDGFQANVMVGMGTDANNERFTFDTCFFADYAREAVLLNGSQSYDHLFINCTFNGAGVGWWGISAYDPTHAPVGAGTFQVIGGGGGANKIADFCIGGYRPSGVSMGYDTESSFKLAVERWRPVATNNFSFLAAGTSFSGTNTAVAGFCSTTNDWVVTSYTNDYPANKWVWEYLVHTNASLGGVHRITNNAGVPPFNPTIPTGATLFNIVCTDGNGITNSYSTRGMLGGDNDKTQPLNISGVNMTSDNTPWNGAIVSLDSRRPLNLVGNRFKTTSTPVKFEVVGGVSTHLGKDSTVTMVGNTFQYESTAYGANLDDNDRFIIGRGDGSWETNKVGGIFVEIVARNNINALSGSSNATTNNLGRTLERAVWELFGTNSMLVVGGGGALGYFGLNGGVTNAAGAGIVHSNNYTAAVVVSLFSGTQTGSKFLADDGTLKTISGGGDALTSNPLSQFAATTSAQLRGVLSNESGTGAALFAGGDIGAATATTPAANDNDTSVATTAFVQTEIADSVPDIDQVLGAGNDAAGESLTGLANLTVTTAAFLNTARATNAIWSNPTNIWKVGLGGNLYARARDETGVTRLDFYGSDNSTVQFSLRDDPGAGEVSTYARFLQVGRISGAAIGTDVQAYDADLTTYAGITPSANVQSLLGAADYSAMRTLLTLVPGTDVQAYDADLTTWAGITPGSGIGTWLATPSSANLRAALTDETGTGAAVFQSGYISAATSYLATHTNTYASTNGTSGGIALTVEGPSEYRGTLDLKSVLVTNAHVIAAQDHGAGTASNLTVKAGSATSGTAGSLNLLSGAATSGTAGSVNITVGALSPSPATGGTVGHITLQSGDGNADKRGGNIYLLPGYGDGGGGGTNILGEDLGAGVTTYNRLIGRTSLDDVAANSFVATTAAGHLTNTLNGAAWTNLTSTNIVGQTGTLAPTSQQTNYTLNLLPGSANDTLVLYTANTNAFFTFTRTNEAFVGRTVIFNALTSSANCSIKFISPTRTNLNFVNYVTNGTIKVVNFFNVDTAGTNVLVSDAGTYRGNFTQ